MVDEPAGTRARPAPLSKNRDFVLLQSGQLLSRAGSGMSGIAYPLLALAVTGSAAQAGLVQAARTVPFLLSAALGVVADRYDRRRLMLGADFLSAAAMTTLVLAILLGDPPLWQLIAVGFIDGMAVITFGAAYSGAFRSVVPREQLPAAASIEQTRASVVRLAAPPLGGVLYAAGRVLPFLADVASYLLSAISVLLMRAPLQESREQARRGFRTDFIEGLRFLWGAPFLRLSALMTAASNFSFTAGQFLVVVLAKREGWSSTSIGLAIALVGATTLAGSVASPWLRRTFSLRVILLSEFWAAFGVLAFVAWPEPALLAVALAVQAFCFPNTDAAIASYRYAVTPDRLTSRVTTAASNIAVIALPLGPLLAGLLLSGLSPRWTVLAVTSVAMVAALIGTASRSIRALPPLREIVGEHL